MSAIKSILTTAFVTRARKKRQPAKKSIKAQFANAQAIETFIGPGSVLDGDLVFSGGLRIEGEVHGNIESRDENGALVICNRAKVFGDVRAPYLVVDGDVQGNVHSNRSLLLEPNAVVAGDVRYHEINMSSGSRVNGELMPQRQLRRNGR